MWAEELIDLSEDYTGTGFDDFTLQWFYQGTVDGLSTVPVPTAIWLFGSGLVGLVGLARRRRPIP